MYVSTQLHTYFVRTVQGRRKRTQIERTSGCVVFSWYIYILCDTKAFPRALFLTAVPIVRGPRIHQGYFVLLFLSYDCQNNFYFFFGDKKKIFLIIFDFFPKKNFFFSKF